MAFAGDSKDKSATKAQSVAGCGKTDRKKTDEKEIPEVNLLDAAAAARSPSKPRAATMAA